MGTYLSAYIEVDYTHAPEPFRDPTQIFSLTEGSFVFDKAYEVFDALAGGREAKMAAEDLDPDRVPLFAPRGIPSPCSLDVACGYYFLVARESKAVPAWFWPAHRRVTPHRAAKWVRDGASHRGEAFQQAMGGEAGRQWPVVSQPGLYNASWLRPDEFDAALAHHRLELTTLLVEFRIVRSALGLLAGEHGPSRVRLVVWFS